jgi:hypothetical protein
MWPTPMAGTHCTPQESLERTNLYRSCWRMAPEWTCRTGAGKRHRVSRRARTCAGFVGSISSPQMYGGTASKLGRGGFLLDPSSKHQTGKGTLSPISLFTLFLCSRYREQKVGLKFLRRDILTDLVGQIRKSIHPFRHKNGSTNG